MAEADKTSIGERPLQTGAELLLKYWPTAEDLRKAFPHMVDSLRGRFKGESTANPTYNSYENGGVVSRELVQRKDGSKNPTVGVIMTGAYSFPTGDNTETLTVLEGQRIAKGVRLLIVPSTADIQRRLVTSGLYSLFMDSGAVFSAPTCGACLGGYMGILAPGEVAISSTNRNFRGRMGSPDSFVYLASPKTVAASAIAGHIIGAKK